MDVAHKRGIVHRDLKPANVLIAADGTLKITDFGLVKRLEGDSSQTRTGSILGTPSYMSPEQAKGETHQVGPAADQYALGAILYELLTGRPPFQGTSVLDTLDQVRKKEPVPPSQLQTKMPRDLETICLKCLRERPRAPLCRRRRPGRRPATISRRDEPIVARPVSVPSGSGAGASATRGSPRGSGQRRRSHCSWPPAVATAAALIISQKNQALTQTNVSLTAATARRRRERRPGRKETEARRGGGLGRQHAEPQRGRCRGRAARPRSRTNCRYVPALEEVRKEVLDRTIAQPRRCRACDDRASQGYRLGSQRRGEQLEIAGAGSSAPCRAEPIATIDSRTPSTSFAGSTHWSKRVPGTTPTI